VVIAAEPLEIRDLNISGTAPGPQSEPAHTPSAPDHELEHRVALNQQANMGQSPAGVGLT